MLNADKTNQINQTKHKDPKKSYYQYMKKKIKIYHRKNFKVITVQEQFSHLARVIGDRNHHVPTSFMNNLQIDEIHQFSTK